MYKNPCESNSRNRNKASIKPLTMENSTYQKKDVRFEGQAWYDGESGNEDEDAEYGGFYVSSGPCNPGSEFVDPEPEKKEGINNENVVTLEHDRPNDPINEFNNAYFEKLYATADPSPVGAPRGLHHYLFDVDEIDYPERLEHDGPGLRDMGFRRRARYGEEGYDEAAEMAEVEAQRKIDDEKYERMKEKKRQRRQRYRANCKARGKSPRRSNWSVVKEILEGEAAGEDSGDLDELSSFLDEAMAEEDGKAGSAYTGEMQIDHQKLREQQEEAASVPLPESDEESIPEAARPEVIPEGAPMSPPVTAQDIFTNLRRVQRTIDRFKEMREEESDEIHPDAFGPIEASVEKGEGKESKQNTDVSFAQPKTAQIALVSTAHWDDVTSGEDESDRECSMKEGRFGEVRATQFRRRMRSPPGGKLKNSGQEQNALGR